MLHTHVFSRNHFAVEESCLGTVLLVVFFNKSECILDELDVFRIVVDLYSEEFGCFYQTIDTDCKILTSDIDEACIKERKHALFLQGLEILIICKLYLVDKVHNLS